MTATVIIHTEPLTEQERIEGEERYQENLEKFLDNLRPLFLDLHKKDDKNDN